MDNATRRLWRLREDVTFLNHGSFGATPRSVLAAQAALRDELEAEPVAFFLRRYPLLLDQTRAELCAFLGCAAADLVFVANATTGANTVMASWPLLRGDEVLTIDHAYPACRNALDVCVAKVGATVRTVALPLPCTEPAAVVDAVVAAIGPRTRYALIDAVTSPSALVLPVAALVAALRERGVETLVDAAHAPGMLPLALDITGAAWTTGNLHKWACAPKSAAFLHIRRDMQRDAAGRDAIAPLVTSHGHSAAATAQPRLHQTFDWCGTFDPTAILSIPAALTAVVETDPDGWPARMARNHALACAMADRLEASLPCKRLTSDAMSGSMAAVLLDSKADATLRRLPPIPRGDIAAAVGIDPLQDWLFRVHAIEVPIIAHSGRRFLRVSAQVYNTLDDVEVLISAVAAGLQGCEAGAFTASAQMATS
jgi:isopenicillin-N epimerase